MATTSKMNIQRGILPDADPVLWFDVEGVSRLDAEGVVGDIQTTVIGDVFDQSSESLNILVADFCHGSPHRVHKRLGVQVGPMTGRVFGEVVSRTRSGVHVGVIDSAVLAGWLQQADAMARQPQSNKNDFIIFIDAI